MTKYAALRTVAAVTAVILTPSTGALLAAPAAPAVALPQGVAAWRADPRGLPDPVTATPAEVRSRLAELAAAELAVTYPGVIGGLDGAPVALRYRANEHAARGYPAGHYLLFDSRGGAGWRRCSAI
ncbi:hypothetical protein M1L60_24660 [Actinoplanes sp. TRM 88003]|uniref:Uncharacterized protein n=1 Tax=Paractinoplanes aksuensis TaxID=2939490 RepID=A0ABT1DSJ3_9ACTN|nr:hypothetical protein [Actinoplanes aksuensis]MCO8273794.1 hypothetical protein [Actinoplanes aksuensis]